jgi:formiminotetrahydrofolate cyclodeaminase
MKDIAARADGLRDKLTASIDEDSAAFQDVMNAMKLPKETPDEITARTAQIQSATKHATLVPLHTARLCLEALGLIHFVAANGNLNAMSDAASGAFMARAAIDAAGMNVRINAATLEDKAQAQRYVDELKNIQAQALLRVDQVLAEVEKRATLA